MSQNPSNEDARKSEFLAVLDSKIKIEWKYEKKHRIYLMLINNWGLPLIRGTLVVLVGQQAILGKLNQERDSVLVDSGFLWVVLILSALSFIIPFWVSHMRFQQRQEVYDTIARAYESIQIQLRLDHISVDEAIKRFTKLYEKPTEKQIRQTP